MKTAIVTAIAIFTTGISGLLIKQVTYNIWKRKKQN